MGHLGFMKRRGRPARNGVQNFEYIVQCFNEISKIQGAQFWTGLRRSAESLRIPWRRGRFDCR